MKMLVDRDDLQTASVAEVMRNEKWSPLFGIWLVPVRLREGATHRLAEVAEFYWCTDLSTEEIRANYGIRRSVDLLSEAGPAALLWMPCRFCSGEVLVRSRAAARKKAADEERDRRHVDGGLRPVLAWALADVCEACELRIKGEDAYAQRQRSAAYEDRRRLLRSMPYKEYLRTPEWQATRESKLRSARYRCQVCGGGGLLDVHHRTYERRGHEKPDDLTVLCRDCHGLFHEKSKLKVDPPA